jgi:hypothetical protein
MVLVNSGFHMRKNISKFICIWAHSLKKVCQSLIGWKGLRNTSLKGHQIISLSRAPTYVSPPLFWDVTSCQLVNSYHVSIVLQRLHLFHEAVQEEWEEVTGGCRKLHNKEVHDLYPKNPGEWDSLDMWCRCEKNEMHTWVRKCGHHL